MTRKFFDQELHDVRERILILASEVERNIGRSVAALLQRNLLYTAVTRARRLLVLVGSRRALRMALDNAEPSLRLSGLATRLRGAARGTPGQGA